MSGPDRRVGQVALVPFTTGDERAMWVAGRGWVIASGARPDSKGYASIRPLVVIDPEDREQVERLAEGAACTRQQMEYALDQFANPTPPKPDEPQGLGAVVEDADGTRWVRTHLWLDAHWREACFEGCYRTWPNIKAVRVLSEGVVA